MSLQYISDRSGVTTAVVIPISEWEAILVKHSDIKELVNDSSGENKVQKQKPSDFKGTLTKKDAARFDKHLAKARKEWDRDSY